MLVQESKAINIKLFIFDFDGVIVDSGKDIANAVNQTLRHFGKSQLEVTTIVGYVGDGAETLLRRSFGQLSDEEMQIILPYYKEYYLIHCAEETTLYAGVNEFLEKTTHLKRAIVTNKPELITIEMLKTYKISEHFDLVIGPESVNILKPDPEGINKVLKELFIDPENAMMIGDSAGDIKAGKAAGVYTCGMKNGLGNLEQLLLQKPDFAIENLMELIGL